MNDAPDSRPTEPGASAAGSAGNTAARYLAELIVAGVVALLALLVIAGASLVAVGYSAFVQRWLGLPSLQVLLAMCGMLLLIVTVFMATAVWRSLRLMHDRILTLAEQQQSLLLLLAQHTGVVLEGLDAGGTPPDAGAMRSRWMRGPGPRKPRQGRR
jgi:hypothetical protein